MINPPELTLEALLQQLGAEMELTLVSGSEHLSRVINSPELNRPGLALAGFHEVFAYDRIQIMGNTEMSYLASLPPTERMLRLESMLKFPVPCLIMTNGAPVPQEVQDAVVKFDIVLFSTNLPTTRAYGLLNRFLEQYFAPLINVHGNLLDVFGIGVLIMGSSGVGKSECALELIERGHRLVADDQVIIRRMSKDSLIGKSSDVLKYHMEVRGLGILNLEMLFGIASVIEEKSIEVVIWLEKWKDTVDYERLGIDDDYHTIFDVKIPKYTLPVQPGRNISILVEMAALTQRLKNSGINPASIMEEQLIARMSGNPAQIKRFYR